MNRIGLLTAALLLSVSCVNAAPPPEPPPIVKLESAYSAGRLSISPFAAYKATEIGKYNGKAAGGLAVSYAVADNIEVEVSALSYGLSRAPVIGTFDEGAVNFKGYLPLGDSGFAPFGLIGYTRDHANDENLMNAGAGLSFRHGAFNAFADGQYRQRFTRLGNQFLFRVGVGVSF